jgi:hypothetical protein
MNIHEYQSKAILKEFGVKVPEGYPAFRVDEAVTAAQKLPGTVKVVKAQIHAGGRGKAGGVKLARSLAEVKQFAEELLGSTLVTKQTGPQGKEVHRLLIEAGADIEKEYYLSFVLDRTTGRIVMMGSEAGGMDIETVARETPEKDPEGEHRPGGRPRAVPDESHGLRAAHPEGFRAPRAGSHGRPLPRVPRQGLQPCRDESASCSRSRETSWRSTPS